MLLSSDEIKHSQCVSVLAAAAPSADGFSEQSTNDEFLSAVNYKQLASVVNQYERASNEFSDIYCSFSQLF